MVPPLLDVVTGKGGVGKTTVACSLALAHRAAGRRVLLAEFNGGGRAAAALGVASLGYGLQAARPGLTLIDLDPESSLKEYVLLIIKVEALYRLVFENRFVRAFLRLLPALGELTMLGKIWYEWAGKGTPTGEPPYDAIVLDIPATGHAKAILSAPLAVMASVPTGPMRDNARRIDEMLLSSMTSLFVVATPADTPVAEAEELLAYARERKLAAAHVVVNRSASPLPAGALEAVTERAGQSPAAAPLVASLSERAARIERGEAALGRLGEPGQASPILCRLPLQAGSLGQDELAAFAARLATARAPK